MHGRATRTRAWCGHVHAHSKDMHVRVATNRAGILLAIMRPGQLKMCGELEIRCVWKYWLSKVLCVDFEMFMF